MAHGPDTKDTPAFVPLSTYQDFGLFWDRLVKSGGKSPSVLALHSLTLSKPQLAREIFDRAVMEPFMRLMQKEWPQVRELSHEGARRVEELRTRFLQEPALTLMQLEAIFVIELVDPHARNLVRSLSHGKLSLEDVRTGEHRDFANKVEATSAEYAQVNLIQYVRERENRIMLELVRALDGRPVETQALAIFEKSPNLKRLWYEFGDGSFLGEEGAKRITSWIFGYIEF